VRIVDTVACDRPTRWAMAVRVTRFPFFATAPPPGH
jgi:hypothetical protein